MKIGKFIAELIDELIDGDKVHSITIQTSTESDVYYKILFNTYKLDPFVLNIIQELMIGYIGMHKDRDIFLETDDDEGLYLSIEKKKENLEEFC